MIQKVFVPTRRIWRQFLCQRRKLIRKLFVLGLNVTIAHGAGEWITQVQSPAFLLLAVKTMSITLSDRQTLVVLSEQELIDFGEMCAEKAIQKYRREVEFKRGITVEQAALEAGKHERTIRRWIDNGSLPARLKDDKSYEIEYGLLLKRINRT